MSEETKTGKEVDQKIPYARFSAEVKKVHELRSEVAELKELVQTSVAEKGPSQDDLMAAVLDSGDQYDEGMKKAALTELLKRSSETAVNTLASKTNKADARKKEMAEAFASLATVNPGLDDTNDDLHKEVLGLINTNPAYQSSPEMLGVAVDIAKSRVGQSGQSQGGSSHPLTSTRAPNTRVKPGGDAENETTRLADRMKELKKNKTRNGVSSSDLLDWNKQVSKAKADGNFNSELYNKLVG